MFDYPSPKMTLQRFGLLAKKSFGQNFLSDAHLATKLAALAPLASTVVEIGAGLGGLTALLLNRGHRVVAVERDRELLPVLQQSFAPALSTGQLTLLEADAKQLDYAALFGNAEKRVLMGNLPYQITGPLLQLTASLAPHLTSAIFMVQLEVAERLTAAPSTPQYGALTVYTQAAFHVARPFVVRRGAFYPQPGVDSAVVELRPLEQPLAKETPVFRQLVKQAFQQRRKTLRNAWQRAFPWNEAQMQACAEAAGISLSRRGETLSVAQFAAMARATEPHA